MCHLFLMTWAARNVKTFCVFSPLNYERFEDFASPKQREVLKYIFVKDVRSVIRPLLVYVKQSEG